MHTGAGAYSGCCYCDAKGEYSKTLSKMVYLEHRRFLPSNHFLRKERAGFPNTKAPRGCPKEKNMMFIDAANDNLDKTTSLKSKKRITRNTGCKGVYSLRSLCHHDRYLNTPVEPMHLLKNIIQHIVYLISGAEDSWKVHKEEKIRRRFPTLWAQGKQKQLPPAPFRLTPEEAKLANARACSIRVPVGFGWKPKAIFSTIAVGMKSHSWKQMISTAILKYCIRGTLGRQQRQTMFYFCNVLGQLCAVCQCNCFRGARVEYPSQPFSD